MSFLNLEELPFVGMSHEFVGENQGAAVLRLHSYSEAGARPALHTHPYTEVAFTIEGTAAITVADETREVKAGGIVVIPANTPHRFVNSFNMEGPLAMDLERPTRPRPGTIPRISSRTFRA